MTAHFTVELTPRAFADVSVIRAYLLQYSPAGADNVRAAFAEAIELLQTHPLIGRERSDLGVRTLGVRRYSYTLYYRVDAQIVQVLHVRDDRRQPLQPGQI